MTCEHGKTATHDAWVSFAMNKGSMIRTMAGLIMVVCCMSVAARNILAAEFYVDSQHGSDEAAGRSRETAWQSLAPVNANHFQPGDRILLKAGSRFSGQFKPQGSGALHRWSAPANRDRSIRRGTQTANRRPRRHAGDDSPVQCRVLGNPQPRDHQPGRRSAAETPRRPGGDRRLRYRSPCPTARSLYPRRQRQPGQERRGGGSAIKWQNRGRRKRSRFDGLLIEGCHLARCERNGINAGGYTRGLTGIRASMW